MSFINSVNKKNNQINLYKLDFEVIENEIQQSSLFSDTTKICFIDLETTGLKKDQDEIIEIALRLVKVDKNSGKIISIESSYESFNDSTKQLDPIIITVTGITNEMIRNHKIDWNCVHNIISDSDIVLAHNAQFDRGFLDRYLPVSKEKLWACSHRDIDWLHRGFVKQSLELLSIWHGFYYESHRAMNDVDALIHLLTHNSYNENHPILELITNSKKIHYKVTALNSPFETKDLLKSNYYKWDPKIRSWWKMILEDELDKEREWLSECIYNGYCLATIEQIAIIDKYK